MGSIITVRIILILCTEIITNMGDYYYSMPCDKIQWIIGSQATVLQLFPGCQAMFSGQVPTVDASLLASMTASKENAAAAFDMSFGMAVWLALFIHAALAEIYVSLALVSTGPAC